MEKLKAEMERKKAMAEAMRQKVVNSSSSEDTKFLRQRDKELLKEQELEEAQRQLDAQREERRRVQQQREEEARASLHRSTKQQQKGASMSTSATISQSTYHPNLRVKYEYILRLPVLAIKKRLRSFREPVTIFGETDSDRKERLLYLCIEKALQGWIDNDLPVEDGAESAGLDSSASKDDASQQHPPKKTKLNESSSTRTTDSTNDSKVEDINESESDEENDNDDEKNDDVVGKKRQRSSSRPANGLYFDPSIQYHKIEGLGPEKVIFKFFRSLVKQWEADLNARPDFEKSTGRGREETKAQKKCKDYIRPLFKLCQRKEVPPDILHRLNLMVQHCEEGNFVKANDEYMRTAIGNAAWPMGLTMVGIHERSGRERISTAKVQFSSTAKDSMVLHEHYFSRALSLSLFLCVYRLRIL
jgi:pre-mRNA-splicing factor 18